MTCASELMNSVNFADFFVAVLTDTFLFAVFNLASEPHGDGGTPGTRKFSRGFDLELIIFFGEVK